MEFQIEADCFWCLGWLLDGIQDNYTFAQPGIQRQVAQLEDLIERIQPDLHEHLMSNSVQFLQFAFRWFNNLLMREVRFSIERKINVKVLFRWCTKIIPRPFLSF